MCKLRAECTLLQKSQLMRDFEVRAVVCTEAEFENTATALRAEQARRTQLNDALMKAPTIKMKRSKAPKFARPPKRAHTLEGASDAAGGGAHAAVH